MDREAITIDRPQPLGAFPLPAGYLLVAGTDDPEVGTALAELAAGRQPAVWPAALAGHRLAHEGAYDAAAAVFAAEPADDAVAAYNRFVIDPEGTDPAALRAALPADVAPLVDVISYAVGLTDQPPLEDGATGEVLALVLAARASAWLDAGDVASAVDLLRRAADAADEATATPLAGVLLGNLAVVAHDHRVGGEDPVADLRRALKVLATSDLDVARAELHLQLGLLLHEEAAAGRAPLTEAVDQYYSALQLVGKADAPHVWAAANLNLGTAYLTMPMVEASDQLRAGIAMQALRASLEVFTKTEHPQEWSSAQMNLANALVYTPSTHQGDNVVEAVERYEEVLELRERDGDPVGRARILANQGNALAHLGVFDHAKAKLYEARFLFEEQEDHDAVMVVRGVLDEIAKQTVPDGAPRVAGIPEPVEVARLRDAQPEPEGV
jgi:tetratricopeptide (TPR) repeat protein